MTRQEAERTVADLWDYELSDRIGELLTDTAPEEEETDEQMWDRERVVLLALARHIRRMAKRP